MISYSSSVSAPALPRMLSLMPIFPMSCSSAPRRSTSISLSETCICRPMATEMALTRSEWPAV